MDIIATPLGWIMRVIYNLVGNYGIAILLFTLVTKLALFPLGIKQQKSTAKMALFKPKIDALNKKYANNKEKLNQETSKLYSEEGFSPFSGCLPMLIQLPIIFGLMSVINYPLTHIFGLGKDIARATEIATEYFGGAEIAKNQVQIKIVEAVKASPHLFSELGDNFVSTVSGFKLDFFGINLASVPTFAWNLLLIIPILAGVTAFISSILTQKLNEASMGTQAQQGGGAMKMMMYFMPLVSLGFAFTLPAGVGLYWSYSNLFALLQTFILSKWFSPKKLQEKVQQEMDEKKKKRQERLKAAGRYNPNSSARDDIVETEGTEISPDGTPRSDNMSASRKIAEARKRMAEKYGDTYTD